MSDETAPAQVPASDFTWQGQYGKGAMAAHRAQKRTEADERNALNIAHCVSCTRRHRVSRDCHKAGAAS